MTTQKLEMRQNLKVLNVTRIKMWQKNLNVTKLKMWQKSTTWNGTKLNKKKWQNLPTWNGTTKKIKMQLYTKYENSKTRNVTKLKNLNVTKLKINANTWIVTKKKLDKKKTG